MKIVRQRTEHDCGLCCAAMALGSDYNDLVRAGAAPWRATMPTDYAVIFDRFGLRVSYSTLWLALPRPAIVIVREPAGHHAVYWTGLPVGMVFDPARETPVSLDEYLHRAVGWWQWWPRDQAEQRAVTIVPPGTARPEGAQ